MGELSIKQKLCVIFWKSLILRWRNPILLVLEILCPLAFIYLTYKASDLMKGDRKKSKQVVENPLLGIESFGFEHGIYAYTPPNAKTDHLMTDMVQTMENTVGYYNVTVKAFESEDQLESWLKLQKQEISNYYSSRKPRIGVVFKDIEYSNTPSKLNYKIRVIDESGMKTDPYANIPQSFEESDNYLVRNNPYSRSYFLTTQLWIDTTFLKFCKANPNISEIFVGSLPTLRSDITEDAVTLMLYFFLSLTYVFFIMLLAKSVLQEKETGIKELSKMVGMTPCMVWGQWLVYALLVQIPVCIIIAIMLSVIRPLVLQISPFIVFTLLFLFVINVMALVFAATCVFNSSTRGTVLIVTLWIVVHMATVRFTIVKGPNGLGLFLEPLVCLLLPLFNLTTTFRVILSYEEHGISWTPDMFFSKGFTSSLSVGLGVLIFVLSICFYGLLAFFLDAIHPGRYGVAKPINFMCLWCRKRKRDESGRKYLPKTYEAPPKSAKVGIEIRGLRKEYGVFHRSVAVKNVDLDIYEGEIMALLGHNGAGKTTTMSMITGMFSPSGGTIRVNGEDINRGGTHFRQNLGLCPQQNVFFPTLTVIEHLMFFSMLKGISRAFSKVHGMKIIEMLGIADKKNARVGSLSGGMKRRLCLAIAMAGNPKVLVLDEPTSGLDPENRRVIWDIVLGMRGQRTILITTHFMEEADVLGDRIAIMDKGEVVCCGTTMFLKKLYGAGYQVHILKREKVSAREIERFVGQNYRGERVSVKILSPTEVSFVLRENDVESFPSLFAALEASKGDLGITGMSVTCSTMEDVFLKVADMGTFRGQEDAGKRSKTSIQSVASDRSSSDENRSGRLTGCRLLIHQALTLMRKKLVYFRSQYICLLVTFVLCCLIVGYKSLGNSLSLKSDESGNSLKIELDLYPRAVIPVAFAAAKEDAARAAVEYIQRHKAKAELLSQNSSLVDHAMKLAENEAFKYEYTTLLGLSLFDHKTSVMFQGKALGGFHLPAMAVNLLTNVLLQVSGTGSIQVENHPFHRGGANDCPEHSTIFTNIRLGTIGWWFTLTAVLLATMSQFAPFIIDEKSSGFKHQQYLAGVSPALYWLVNFTVDLMLYLLMTSVYLLVALSVCSHLWNQKITGVLFLVLFLHGFSGLFFLYMFASFFRGQAMGSSMYVMFHVAFTIVASFIMPFWLDVEVTVMNTVILLLLMFNPAFCAAMSFYYISWRALEDYACLKCPHVCMREVGNVLRMPWDFDERAPKRSNDMDMRVILHYFIALALLWLLYFAVTQLVDHGIASRIKVLLCYQRPGRRDDAADEDEDEDVTVERELVRLYREQDERSVPLRAEGLRKRFCRGPRAVDDVSFAVEVGECFGLLGVNGAGKTTTFRMVTGELTPDAGDATILADSVVRQRRGYMRQVGYCPQFDSSPDWLTGRETLTTMARLRGVRKMQAQALAQEWLVRLGFEEHADKRASTYSGGTRRKLSTAMAFVGDPVVVFLDEPTTGVDPAARRKLWNVLQARKKAGQSIVLTSHSMEECEALCSRLTILVGGHMRCIGSCEYLKSKFSQGYNVQLKIEGNAGKPERDALKRAFLKQFPRGELRDEHRTLVSFHIADPAVALSRLFAAMLRLIADHSALEDFSVSNTTLEQLFLSFAHQERPEARRN